MTTIWKDGGPYGSVYREIVSEDEGHVIARVRTRSRAFHRPVTNPTIPSLEGEANFRLVLKAPQMLEALEAIAALKPSDWYDPIDLGNIHNQCGEIALAAIAAVKGDEETNT